MAKGNAQLQKEGDKHRRAAVDTKNKNAASKDKAEIDALANVPLNAEEMTFCVDIAAQMNKGRRADAPMQADVLRYSKLRGRMDVKETEE